MEKISLKPCPFCGTTLIKIQYHQIWKRPNWRIHCCNCHLTMDFPDKEALATKWNRRVEDEKGD